MKADPGYIPQARVEHSGSDILLHPVNCVPQLLRNRMTPQAVHIKVIGFGGENEKSYHGHVRQLVLQIVIQTGQRFDEHVGAFVTEFISSGDEEIQCLIEIKIEVTVEMSAREFVNLLLGDGMQILKLVDGREFLNIQSVGCYEIGFAFQQMLRFITGNLRDGGKDMRQVCGGPFNAISMIDLPFARLFVHTKFVQIVIEIGLAGT